MKPTLVKSTPINIRFTTNRDRETFLLGNTGREVLLGLETAEALWGYWANGAIYCRTQIIWSGDYEVHIKHHLKDGMDFMAAHFRPLAEGPDFWRYYRPLASIPELGDQEYAPFCALSSRPAEQNQ